MSISILSNATHLTCEKKTAKIALFISSIILAYYVYYFRTFVQDDALIYLRVADIFLKYGNLGYNPNENVEAFTGFFWQWICIGIRALNLPPTDTLKVVSLSFGIGTQWFFLLLSCRFFANPLWAFLLNILFAFYPPRLLWSNSGLETEVFLFSVVWSAWMFVKASESPQISKFWHSSLAFGFMVLNRPEAPILIAAAVGAMFLDRRLRQVQYFMALLTIPVMIYLGLLFFRLHYFGLPFPNTYYAKTAGGIYLFKRGYYAVKGFAQRNFNMPLSILAFFGWIVLWFEKKLKAESAFLALWCLLYGTYYVKSGGDIMAEDRLLIPIMPAVFLSSLIYLDDITNIVTYRIRKFSIKWSFIPLSLIVICCLTLIFHYYSKTKDSEGLLPYIFVLPALENVHADIGKYIQEHSLPGDKAILTDAGMTAWKAPDVYFMDFFGLGDTNTSMILYRNGFNPWLYDVCYWYPSFQNSKANSEKAYIKYTHRENPRWVVGLFIPPENSPEQELLRNAVSQCPDSISPRLGELMNIWGYFGVFRVDSIRNRYKPLKFYEYNPTYYLMLAEKREP